MILPSLLLGSLTLVDILTWMKRLLSWTDTRGLSNRAQNHSWVCPVAPGLEAQLDTLVGMSQSAGAFVQMHH